jgi:hypothetical protein
MAMLRQLTGEAALSAAVQCQSLRVRINHESKCHSDFFFLEWRYTCTFRKVKVMKSLFRHFPLRRRVAVLLFGAVLISLASACRKTDADVTEILRAAGNGDLANARRLLNHNPNLAFSKNGEGFTALHYAASYGYIEIAELLLAKNADANAKTGKGDTPLHYAASYGHKDIAELLLSNKANADAQDGIGRTPLYDAAGGGRIEEVGCFLPPRPT